MWPFKKTEPQKPARLKGCWTRTWNWLLSLFSALAKKSHQRQTDFHNNQLGKTEQKREVLNRTETKLLTSSSQVKRFVISSLFLHECFRELAADDKEQFFFITGSETDNLMILDQTCGFEHVSRTAAGVEGEIKSTHTLLCKLEQFNHRLLGHFHIHPGRGIGATLPSSIDRAFQERLERGGYPTVAAVFNRDRLVRFFRLDNNFELQVFGKGVESTNEPNVFHLTNFD
jgi:hypothetical protein